MSWFLVYWHLILLFVFLCRMFIFPLDPWSIFVLNLYYQQNADKLSMNWHCCHRRAVAQPCVNGDRLSKGRMAKFDPAQIRNPLTDRHKIWNRWLCPRDDFPCKSSWKSVHWGLLGKWVKYNENFSNIYIPFFVDRPADFHVRWFEQRGLTQKSNLFGNRNSKLISNPPPKKKISPKSKIGPKNGQKFSAKNAPV